MPRPATDLIPRPTPLLCPKCRTSLLAGYDPRTHHALSLYCPDCAFEIDLSLQRRIFALREKMQKDSKTMVSYEEAAENMQTAKTKTK